MERIDIKDKEIQTLKKVIPFEIKDGEKLLTVIFVSEDQKIHYSLICKDNEKFYNLENRLYDIYPEFIEKENCYTINGNKINRFKTLKENMIEYSDIIMLTTKEIKVFK